MVNERTLVFQILPEGDNQWFVIHNYNNRYFIESFMYKNPVLDVTGSGETNGTKIGLYRNYYQINQQFNLIYDEANKATNLLLVNYTNSSITIAWNSKESNPNNIKGYGVYRNFDSLSPLLDVEHMSFTNTTVKPYRTYVYAIKVVYQDGSESLFSDFIKKILIHRFDSMILMIVIGNPMFIKHIMIRWRCQLRINMDNRIPLRKFYFHHR